MHEKVACRPAYMPKDHNARVGDTKRTMRDALDFTTEPASMKKRKAVEASSRRGIPRNPLRSSRSQRQRSDRKCPHESTTHIITYLSTKTAQGMHTLQKHTRYPKVPNDHVQRVTISETTRSRAEHLGCKCPKDLSSCQLQCLSEQAAEYPTCAFWSPPS